MRKQRMLVKKMNWAVLLCCVVCASALAGSLAVLAMMAGIESILGRLIISKEMTRRMVAVWAGGFPAFLIATFAYFRKRGWWSQFGASATDDSNTPK